MTIAELLCGAVLLPAIGVMASVLSRPNSAEKASDNNNPSSDGPSPPPGLQGDLERLRAQHQVRLVEQREEGCDVAHLPAGVYGFTYSPLQETPMFRKKATQSFEVHKLSDESVHLVGFVTESDAKRLSSLSGQVEARLYPDPWEDAFSAASIPVSRIQSSRGPSRSAGNAVWLVVT